MALDFELKLVMPSDNAAIFCRGSLESTRYLVKHQQPAIASAITQVLNQLPLPLGDENNDDIYTQSFFVDIPPAQVNSIIELLLNIIENNDKSYSDGFMVLAKSLFENWIELSKTMA
ncbi:MAG: hypothetical protein ACI8WB_001759 [Phenylobacterium sp.]|jgi:hypothetical protein